MKKTCYLLILGMLLTATLSGCDDNIAADDQQTKVAYYCKETKKIIVTTKQETPAINPETGRRTLFPTMYCEQCKAWRPIPSVEQAQKNAGARKCPKCKKMMLVEGPLLEKKK